MKNSILYLILFATSIGSLVAQDAEPSKNKFGAILSINIFGFNDDFNKVDVGGGFYFSRKISKRLSIYTEIDGSSRNYCVFRTILTPHSGQADPLLLA